MTRALEFLQLMLREFKKGAKNLFDHFNKILDEVFGFGNEVGDAALTDGERRWKEKKRKIQEKLDRKRNKFKKRKYEANLQKRKIVDSKGLRGSVALSALEKKEIFEYSKKYLKNQEVAEDVIQFSSDVSTQETGYVADWDLLTVNSDIKPGKFNTANSRLSWKAAIAHELEGHRMAARSGKTFNDSQLNFTANGLWKKFKLA